MDPRFIDKRVVQRNLNAGRITKDEYDKFLASLPDLSPKAEPVTEKLFGDAEDDEASASDVEAEPEE